MNLRKNDSLSQVVVLGVPFDEGSSFLKGSALAPPHIRNAFYSSSSNLSVENGIDLGETEGWTMAGDLVVGDQHQAVQSIEKGVLEYLSRGNRVVALGGDHSITFPLVRAAAHDHQPFSILQLDAHPDLYDELDGNRYSHACPFARIMEEALVKRLVQVGVRTLNPHQAKQADRFGVEIIPMRELGPDLALEFETPLYLTIDLDVLDPAFAPGVSHYEPGGMSTRMVLDILHHLRVPIIGADIVEYNPTRDVNGLTAMVAAKLLKEILAQMLT